MRRFLLVAVGALGLALAGAACGSVGGGSDPAQGDKDAATAMEAAPAVADAAQTAAALTGAAAADTAAAGGGQEAASEVESSVLTPILGPRVIQTASLALSVDRGRFEEAVSHARTIATGLGGYVTSSTASEGRDGRLVRGSLVLRVPEHAYGRAMTQLSRLGRVQGREEAGQDVSGEFVDLRARQRHLEAVETQLLGFLRRTRTIAEALAVQSRLNDVQLQLEEVRGRLVYLEDQTSFATITLQVSERGAPVAGPGDGWGIGDAWNAAARGFLKVVGGALVALVVAGPILLIIGAAFVAGRIVFRRRRAEREAGSALG